jgi:hypothetical protein
VPRWRGTLLRNTDGEQSSSFDVAQRAVEVTFTHTVALTKFPTKLQLESLTIFRHSALDSLKLLELLLRVLSRLKIGVLVLVPVLSTFRVVYAGWAGDYSRTHARTE